MDQQGASMVYLGGCQLSFAREQLGSRGIIFQGDNFVRFMGIRLLEGDSSTRSDWSGSIWIRYYIEKRTTLYGENRDRLFRDTGNRRSTLST